MQFKILKGQNLIQGVSENSFGSIKPVINKKKSEKRAIKKAVQSIKKGETIVFPTDTVYGLIADATNKKAVDKIFQIKKRDKNKPIPIFIKDIKTAKKLALIDKEQEKFLKKVWPGKVTVVLKRPKKINFLVPSSLELERKERKKIYGIAKKTIALRIPDYRPINILLEKINLPLVGTSANISGKPASTEIKKIINQFENQKYQPDLIIEAGKLKPAKPSKIIDLTCSTPKILRR